MQYALLLYDKPQSLTKDRAIIVESINGNYRQLFLLHFNSEVTQLLNNTDSLLT